MTKVIECPNNQKNCGNPEFEIKPTNFDFNHEHGSCFLGSVVRQRDHPMGDGA